MFAKNKESLVHELSTGLLWTTFELALALYCTAHNTVLQSYCGCEVQTESEYSCRTNEIARNATFRPMTKDCSVKEVACDS